MLCYVAVESVSCWVFVPLAVQGELPVLSSEGRKSRPIVHAPLTRPFGRPPSEMKIESLVNRPPGSLLSPLPRPPSLHIPSAWTGVVRPQYLGSRLSPHHLPLTTCYLKASLKILIGQTEGIEKSKKYPFSVVEDAGVMVLHEEFQGQFQPQPFEGPSSTIHGTNESTGHH